MRFPAEFDGPISRGRLARFSLAGLAGSGGLRLVDRFIRSLTWQSPYKPLDLTSEMQTFIGHHTSAR
jgi:hypothetical protein